MISLSNGWGSFYAWCFLGGYLWARYAPPDIAAFEVFAATVWWLVGYISLKPGTKLDG